MMRVNWVVTSGYVFDPTVNLELVKSVGPIWGSWKSWRACSTDNVICHDIGKSRELINRAFQAVCNFYVPKKNYQDLSRPVGVRLYDGDFSQEVDDLEDIVSLHLAGSSSDIVLMLGFDLRIPKSMSDRFEMHKIRNRHGLIRSVINSQENTQWVAVDHQNDPDSSYKSLSNFTCDNIDSVLKLLA